MLKNRDLLLLTLYYSVSLLLAVAAANPYFAVAMLAACFACIELSPYWAALMHVAGADTMSAGGVLNTGGNAGGLIAIPIIAYLSGHHAWTPAFILGALFAFAAGAACSSSIRCDRPFPRV